MTPTDKSALAEKAKSSAAADKAPGASHDAMANAIRALAMDAVQKANSGHPGMPMGAADIATVLFTKFLKIDPRQPDWPDRDRFVLSAGHGSMLLYAVNYLLGYEDMTIEQIKNFRQLGAITAGHPEYGHVAGVETTTGPLGQGISTAVGMALAERLLAARFGDEVVDHFTYVLASDGDLMEGVSHEAIGLAGHLKLSKLIVLYDDNEITIDGALSLSESGDALKRFEAAGWNAVRIDGHNPAEITAAIEKAQQADRPSLIACRTVIGYGSPNKRGKSSSHGSPLGEEEISLARELLHWQAEPFVIPSETLDAWRIAGLRNVKARKGWEDRLAALPAEKRIDFERRIAGDLPAELGKAISAFKQKLVAEKPKWATRKSSEEALNVINAALPDTIGGSADLTGSNNTRSKGQQPVTAEDFSGSFIHYGIREHGMAAAMNGLALHKGFIPYSGTFLVFTDYCRPAIRLSALMGQRVIYVMTHDSIGLGEDGPTHQPVEHLASLRAMPNLLVFRPADAVETLECWQLALESADAPSILALSRQNLPAMRIENSEKNLCARGAYELVAASSKAKVSLLATGSEVEIAVAAQQMLEKEGIPARVVSMPCLDLFDLQSPDFQKEMLGEGTVKIAIEAAVRYGWDRYIGPDGDFIGMTGFGASAPAPELYKHFNITPEAAVAAAKARLQEKS
ncbi:transketolase [Parvibaculum lavamentivorans DS-1]|uniref:Transketolase n=1 Tax=Parvibaculum lavamentivorans (strain DS-1 / DSM 13023 / NCIMB 13966) TaxID=402881 RepID=A7HUY9_PARL1|nr:transketolase [Parvibaculum lavamentivorans]ABS63722.1 transketolase [Parvibaculum lavamentivorans DS-1]